MTLGEKQRLFTHRIALLIQYAYQEGYELTFGDAHRDERVHGQYGEKKSYAASKSNHKLRLAVDFNLFKDGVYLDSTEDHAPLGEYWLALSSDNAWGGTDGNDGNHYSMWHEGRW